MAPSVKSHKRACVSQPTPRSRTHTSTTLHQSWPPEQTQVLIPQIAFCVFGWEWARDRPLIVCCTYSQVVTKKKVPLSLRGNTEHNTGPQSNLSSRVLILVQPQDLRGLTCPMRLLYREAYFERSCYDFCRLTMKTSFCRQNLFCAQYGLCRVTELSNGWLWFPWRRSMFTLLSSTEFSGKLRNLGDAKRRIRRRSFPWRHTILFLLSLLIHIMRITDLPRRAH